MFPDHPTFLVLRAMLMASSSFVGNEVSGANLSGQQCTGGTGVHEVVPLRSKRNVPMLFEFPASAPAFYFQSTPGKVRLFVGEFGSRSRSIVPLATIRVESDEEVARLIAALESAAWHGNRGPWDAIAETLPGAVVLACNQALANMPPHTSLAIGSDGRPLTVLTSLSHLSPGGEDILRHANAAYDASMQVLIDNYLDDDGDGVCCRLRLLSGESEVEKGRGESVWPEPDSSAVERRHFGPDELGDVLSDPRWLSNKARIHWIWLSEPDDESAAAVYTSEAVWVVEYFDENVADDPESAELDEDERFVLGAWNPWPMTPRTRFVLWRSLICILALLEDGLETWRAGADGPEDDDFMTDFPALVRSQPRSWWVKLSEACSRLVNAARTGESLNPRTPAEEALIYIACQDGWVTYARDTIEQIGSLRKQFKNLPQGENWDEGDQMSDDESDNGPDYDWDEVPAALAGDVDIELLWTPAMDGIENPNDQTNADMGMGDYRPQSWHRRFARYAGDEAFPPSLL